MPKIAPELTNLKVKSLTKKGFYAVGGLPGLHLRVNENGARFWVLRVVAGGKRRDLGLGSYPEVSLSEARDKARKFRAQIRDGIDPVKLKKEARSLQLAEKASEITFKKATKEYLTAKGTEWKSSKHFKRWKNSLEVYAYPTIGDLSVKDIEISHIIKILEPIWNTKTETATRVRGRIESILDWANVRNYRKGENPARWKGYLDKVLASPGKIAKVEHYASLPFVQLGKFIENLKKNEGISSRALEFLILTAARSGEVRGAKWNEIDPDKKLWTIPADRMKAGKEHRVPLSQQAIDLLSALPRFKDNNHVFAAPRGGKLSDMALTAIMRRMNVKAVPHGFRSTFRDWVAEKTNYTNEVAEMALAHTIVNKVEAAYRRGDLFEKRVQMMNDWAEFCYKVPEPKA